MPVAMMTHKRTDKEVKAIISKELDFIRNIFSVVTLPPVKSNDMEDEVIHDNLTPDENKKIPNRARSITELEEKLEKLKSKKTFNLKNKLEKKSISSKLNKKIKKKERQKNNIKTKQIENTVKTEMSTSAESKPKVEQKPKKVFNTDAKLVFSKFDFSNIGNQGKPRNKNKKEKDPKKILENIKQQEQKFKELDGKEESGKVKELKEKSAWKSVLQKAEGEKVKDDPLLLKKSIKKMEQKKKHSQKQWDKRIENVQLRKDEHQKKRRENILNKKKEKKSKIVKTAQKRGRIVIKQ